MSSMKCKSPFLHVCGLWAVVGGCGRDTPSKPALWAVVGEETEVRTCAVSSLWAVVGGRPRDAFTS